MRLDLSSIAKGYAVDRVAGYLEARGIGNHLVEIGGELRGAGAKPDALPWWVALDRPATHTVVALHGLSVATSGDGQRFFEDGGRRYSHIIDPRSGFPVRNGVTAATVLHRECMWADGLATALAVLGPEPGIARADADGNAAAITTGVAGMAAERVSLRFRAMCR
jgi:thiamine biosynthesis lipoprotein